MSTNSTGSSGDALPFDAELASDFEFQNLDVAEARLRASLAQLQLTMDALEDAQIVTSEVLALEFSV